MLLVVSVKRSSPLVLVVKEPYISRWFRIHGAADKLFDRSLKNCYTNIEVDTLQTLSLSGLLWVNPTIWPQKEMILPTFFRRSLWDDFNIVGLDRLLALVLA